MSRTEPTLRTYMVIAVVLFVLLGGTVAASMFSLGAFSPVIALTIAAAKAALVALFFMHVRYASPLVRLVALAGLLWLVFLILLTAADTLSRA